MVLIDRLRQGAAALGIELAEDCLGRQLRFLEELLRWNRRINLTAIKNPDEAVEKHILDSLYLLRVLPQKAALMDLGSGAGLPSIPLAMADSTRTIFSVDSVGKKINFQNHIKRMFELDCLTVIKARIEDAQDKIAPLKFEVVTARALTSIEELVRLGEPFLQPDGVIVAMKGPEIDAELNQAAKLLERLNFQLPQVINYHLPFSQAKRTIVLLKKKS